MQNLITPSPLVWDESLYDGDHDDLDIAFDDFLENFDAILSALSKDGRFYIEGRDMGWRRLSGSATLSASNAREFIAAAFPRTSEWALRGSYDPSKGMLCYSLSHHDAPTGEFYTVREADDAPS